MSPPPSPLIHLRVVHHLPWGWWSQTLSGRSIYLFIYVRATTCGVCVALRGAHGGPSCGITVENRKSPGRRHPSRPHTHILGPDQIKYKLILYHRNNSLNLSGATPPVDSRRRLSVSAPPAAHAPPHGTPLRHPPRAPSWQAAARTPWGWGSTGGVLRAAQRRRLGA